MCHAGIPYQLTNVTWRLSDDRACELLVIIVHTYSQLSIVDNFCDMAIIAVHSESQSQSTLGDCATRQDMKLCLKPARVIKFFLIGERVSDAVHVPLLLLLSPLN